MENLYPYQPGEPVKINFDFAGNPQENRGTFVTRNSEGVLVRFNVALPDCKDHYFTEDEVSPLFKAGDIVALLEGQAVVLSLRNDGVYLVHVFASGQTLCVSLESVLYSQTPAMRHMYPELEQLYRHFVVEETKAGEATVDYPEGSWPEREAQQYFLGVFAGRVDSLARALHCVGYSPEAVKHIRREATKEHLKTQKEH